MTRYQALSSCSFSSQTPGPTDSILRVAESATLPCCSCHNENPKPERTGSGNPARIFLDSPSQCMLANREFSSSLTTVAMYQEQRKIVYKIYYISSFVKTEKEKTN